MPKDAAVKPGSKWWLTAIMGALLLVPAPIFLYQYIDEKEREGGTIRMNWLFVLLYNAFGKVGVAVVSVVVGLCVLVAAVFEYRKFHRTAA